MSLPWQVATGETLSISKRRSSLNTVPCRGNDSQTKGLIQSTWKGGRDLRYDQQIYSRNFRLP